MKIIIQKRKQGTKRLKKTIFILLFILLIALLTANFGINLAFKNVKADAETLNILLADLDKEPLELLTFDSYSPTTLIARTQKYFAIKSELSKKSHYEAEKETIIANFDLKITDYISKLKTYNQVDTSFTAIDLANIDFATKKDSESYLKTLKNDFKKAIVTYNQTAVAPLRWEFEPTEELDFLSTDEKIGLLFSFPIQTTVLTASNIDFINKYHISSISLFSNNVEGEAQVKALTSEIQRLNSKIPFSIAIDQEGEPVERIWWDNVAGAKHIADLSEADQCAEFKVRSELLASLGINWNLGIVADVATDTSSFIYPRTFSSDYQTASDVIATAIECSTKNLTTLKHWPGHGATTVDTHSELGKLNKTDLTDWDNTDNLPFENNLASDSIMVGHLIAAFLGSENPATLSSEAISYLRNTMNYQGLIVSDDMAMLRNSGFDLAQAVPISLAAGVDFAFVVTNDFSEMEAIMQATKATVTSGQISSEDLDQKVVRVLESKNKFIRVSDIFVPKELIY